MSHNPSSKGSSSHSPSHARVGGGGQPVVRTRKDVFEEQLRSLQQDIAALSEKMTTSVSSSSSSSTKLLDSPQHQQQQHHHNHRNSSSSSSYPDSPVVDSFLRNSRERLVMSSGGGGDVNISSSHHSNVFSNSNSTNNNNNNNNNSNNNNNNSNNNTANQSHNNSNSNSSYSIIDHNLSSKWREEVASLKQDLIIITKERDEAFVKISELTTELSDAKSLFKDMQQARANIDHLNQDIESLKISLDSSERIRKQQKDLIALLQKSHAAFDNLSMASNDSFSSFLSGIGNAPTSSSSAAGQQQPPPFSNINSNIYSGSRTATSAGLSGSKDLSVLSNASSIHPDGSHNSSRYSLQAQEALLASSQHHRTNSIHNSNPNNSINLASTGQIDSSRGTSTKKSGGNGSSSKKRHQSKYAPDDYRVPLWERHQRSVVNRSNYTNTNTNTPTPKYGKKITADISGSAASRVSQQVVHRSSRTSPPLSSSRGALTSTHAPREGSSAKQHSTPSRQSSSSRASTLRSRSVEDSNISNPSINIAPSTGIASSQRSRDRIRFSGTASTYSQQSEVGSDSYVDEFQQPSVKAQLRAALSAGKPATAQAMLGVMSQHIGISPRVPLNATTPQGIGGGYGNAYGYGRPPLFPSSSSASINRPQSASSR